MNLRLIFALLGTSALIACAGDKEATDDTAPVGDDTAEGDADADSDSDSDTDSDSDADPLYSSYDGVETYQYDASLTPGNITCYVVWDVTGTPSTTDCPDCVFAFDVSLAYDAASSTVTDDCSGFATDLSYSYGYVDDYYGYGPSMLYYGTYGWSSFANAEFDASTDTVKYVGGIIDYAYAGYYFTYYYTGEAQLTK